MLTKKSCTVIVLTANDTESKWKHFWTSAQVTKRCLGTKKQLVYLQTKERRDIYRHNN